LGKRERVREGFSVLVLEKEGKRGREKEREREGEEVKTGLSSALVRSQVFPPKNHKRTNTYPLEPC